MPSSTPPASSKRSPAAATESAERRSFLLAGLVLAAVILVGVVVVAATSATDPGPRRDTQGQLGEDDGAKPHIIPRPGEGEAPDDPGDRGGWEQLSLFGLLVVAIAGIGLVIFRGSRRTRAGRQAWRAAASTPEGQRTEPAPEYRPSSTSEATTPRSG